MRMPGFQGDYLWELDIARGQLLALADAVPESGYGWSPVEGARSFSAVLVHIALGNYALLHLIGVQPESAEEIYGPLDGAPSLRFPMIIRKNVSLENTVTEKRQVLDLLRRSFESVSESFSQCSPDRLERMGDFFGEPTSIRRVYLRMLAHAHEHMGQAIAYSRAYGVRVPWPDPLKAFVQTAANGGAAKAPEETDKWG